MSWTKKNIHPGKIVSTSQEVEVLVLEVDPEKRRISLGLKQCLSNPWEAFRDEHAVGSTVEGEIRNITEFGLFIGLDSDIDGMAHLSDLDWEKAPEEAAAKYSKGDVVKAVVLDVDVDKERISLGIKQLTDDPFREAISGVKKGDRVTCTVREITSSGLEVGITGGAVGFIRKAELSRDRVEQRPDRFAIGEKLDARITNIDAVNRRLTLSVKSLEIADEKQAMAEFGSSDSGASLGDILGPAIKGRQEQPEQSEPQEPQQEAEPQEAQPQEPQQEAEPQEAEPQEAQPQDAEAQEAQPQEPEAQEPEQEAEPQEPESQEAEPRKQEPQEAS
jgi:small subunit ribosomal protein S1